MVTDVLNLTFSHTHTHAHTHAHTCVCFWVNYHVRHPSSMLGYNTGVPIDKFL